MKGLRRELPPPTSLVVFEAVARHLSFTAAAGELGVSQAATSRQVRILEDHLGVQLFHRTKRQVRLTPAGEQLHASVTMGFGHILTSVRALREGTAGSALTLATSLAFSTFWLIPRIGRFHATHPDIELRLVTSDSESDWLADRVDAAVIFGPGRYPGFAATPLFSDEVVAMTGASAFAEGRYGGAEALLDAPLLHLEQPYKSWISWEDWFARCGITVPGPLAGRRYNNYAMVHQAARDGVGIALGWRRLIGPELRSGALVEVVPERVVPVESYHLLVPESRQDNDRIKAIRDWIVEEGKRDWG